MVVAVPAVPKAVKLVVPVTLYSTWKVNGGVPVIGAWKLIMTDVGPIELAVTAVAGPGATSVVVADAGADMTDVPARLLAHTTNWYVVPGKSPATTAKLVCEDGPVV